MPLPIQQGSVADRLRNFLKITGRAATSVDEVLVPIISVQDLDQMPYRTQQRRFQLYGITAALAAANSFLGIYLPPNVRGVAVVDRITVTTAAAITLDIGWFMNPQTALGATFGNQSVYDVEDNASTGTIANPPSLPPQFFTGQVAATVAQLLNSVKVAANVTQIIPCNYAIRGILAADPAQTRAIAIRNTVVNAGFAVSIEGDWHPDAL